MGGAIESFAIDLDRLCRLFGCRDQKVLEELKEWCNFNDKQEVAESNADSEFDPELSYEEAIEHIIEGRTLEANGDTYVMVLRDICRRKGWNVRTGFFSWCPIHPEFLDEVEARIEKGVRNRFYDKWPRRAADNGS